MKGKNIATLVLVLAFSFLVLPIACSANTTFFEGDLGHGDDFIMKEVSQITAAATGAGAEPEQPRTGAVVRDLPAEPGVPANETAIGDEICGLVFESLRTHVREKDSLTYEQDELEALASGINARLGTSLSPDDANAYVADFEEKCRRPYPLSARLFFEKYNKPLAQIGMAVAIIIISVVLWFFMAGLGKKFRKKHARRERALIFCMLMALLVLPASVSAASDVSVYQGQYYTGTAFNQGTYNFTFEIYDAETGGNLVYSNQSMLTTGYWGQWKVELEGVSAACNNTSKDYFMEITIDGEQQSPRRRLTQFSYIRKDINEETAASFNVTGDLNVSRRTFLNNTLEFGTTDAYGRVQMWIFPTNSVFRLGSLGADGDARGDISSEGIVVYGKNLQGDAMGSGNWAFARIKPDRIGIQNSKSGIGQFYIFRFDASDNEFYVRDNLGNKTFDFDREAGDLSITGNMTVNSGEQVCTAENQLCGGSTPVRFLSSVDAVMMTNTRYLGLGAVSGSSYPRKPAWIADRNLTITGIMWSAFANNRTAATNITLMKSTSGKSGFSDTPATVDIQGSTQGSASGWSESFSQGDLIVIKYHTLGTGSGLVEDLSIAVIGYYD